MSHQLKALAGMQMHNIALLFSNYLRSQGIASEIREHEGEFIIFCQEDRHEDAQSLFTEFIENPHDKKYQQAAWHEGEAVNVKTPSYSALFKQQFISHAGIVTLLVFALCWFVYLASTLGWKHSIFFNLRFFNELSLSHLITEPWRLLGHAFFHFSLLHIVFNTMWWWQLGGAIEKVMGKGELLQLFLITAIFSGLAQFITSGQNFGGLSGVVYGVVGYVWWAGWLAPEKGLELSKPVIGFMLFFLLLGFVEMLPFNVANAAHTVGLISGCALAWYRFR